MPPDDISLCRKRTPSASQVEKWKQELEVVATRCTTLKWMGAKAQTWTSYSLLASQQHLWEVASCSGWSPNYTYRVGKPPSRLRPRGRKAWRCSACGGTRWVPRAPELQPLRDILLRSLAHAASRSPSRLP